MSENTVPFEYTLRPREDQPMYVPVVGEPYNPPPVARYLHLQVKLPFTVNREYGLAVDWQDDAGMRPSADKVQSLASYREYSAGTLELDENGTLWAHYKGENGVEWHNKLTGEPAEFIKAALVKLFSGSYQPTLQFEDGSEDENDYLPVTATPIEFSSWGSDDEEEDEDEYDD